MWAATEAELEDRVSTILQRCADNNITISRKKFEMGSSIQFTGHIISDGEDEREEGVKFVTKVNDILDAL